MFKNWSLASQTKEQTDVELNAHGLSIVEIKRDSNGEWHYIQGSQYNRRITAFTPMTVTGPAAGNDLLKTSADPTGRSVMGTLNNCSGGRTPWGTVLTGEENFHQYFANRNAMPDGPVKANHTRYGVPSGASGYAWSRHYDRFDVAKEPNEPLRFGWVVEFDPYDPTSTPKKRTALGRVKHEAATIQIASNGRVVAYTGDDERFQYAYKFVTNGAYNHFDRKANDGLLDDGTLYVAKFNADGTGQWIPLVAGQSGLTAANGYGTQAQVLIDTRGAATTVGATPMDRPEDMEVNPVNGKVYLALTNNTQRNDTNKDAANPRANNRYGHILEITEDNGDHTSTSFFWEVFMLCGDGRNAGHGTFFAGYDPAQVSMIANPDNITFDSKGNLWISTDGQPGTLNINDGVFAVPTDGDERGRVRQLFSAVPGGEVASLVFNPDDTTMFVSVQHPGEGGKWTDNASDLISTFPDGRGPNRPSVLTISRATGSPVVGS
ncbi:MAG: PhoX family phosphatase [Bryobacterales bacterium]|nr:PhoX family phosphatase [Bryobacterales bacterium]